MDKDVLEKLVGISISIYAAEDDAALFQALSDGIRLLGFDSFLFSLHKASKHDIMLDATFSTFPSDFIDHYARLHWIDVDPIIQQAMSMDQPFVWNSAESRYEEIRKQRFIDHIRSLHMCSGLVVLIAHKDGTRSGISAVSLICRTVARNIGLAVELMTRAAVAKSEMLGLCPSSVTDETANICLLSEAQREILKWMAEGKSNPDIATITGITERTIRYHVSEILRKLGVATRMQAVAIFQASGQR